MATTKAERSVAGIMSPFQMVGGAETVDSAMHVMREHGLNAILVEPDAAGEWGIMTKRDVLRKVIVPNRSPASLKVDEIANRFLITCARDTSLLHVARQMMNNGIRRIVVMENGQPLGIVTEADLFRLVEQSGWGVAA